MGQLGRLDLRFHELFPQFAHGGRFLVMGRSSLRVEPRLRLMPTRRHLQGLDYEQLFVGGDLDHRLHPVVHDEATKETS